MSERSDQDYVHDMQEAARRAVSYCAGMTYEQFLADERTQDAVVRNLEILGEAAKLVSSELRLGTPAVPWRAVARMRDRLIHAYFGVNWDIVWDVVTGDLPPLVERLQTLQRETGG
jgi:uncharacterized protein with HEPN domain